MQYCNLASRHRCRVGREGSLFQRVFSSMNGIDPYAAAVSDVYQDLFGEGSYAGKGIYEVDAFEAALAGRVPDRHCSAMICSRAYSPVLVSPPISRSWRSSQHATTLPRDAITVGRAATGSCCRGSSAAAEGRGAASCRRSAAGKCSTICAALCRHQPACCRSRRARVAAAAASVWTLLHPRNHPAARLDSGLRCNLPAPRWDNAAQPSGRARRRSGPRAGPVGTCCHVPGAPGMADG